MDHYKFCRLCLCAGNSIIDVFEGENHLGYVVEETIQEVLQFKIEKRVGMPWMACSNCLNRLIEFKQFKRRCLESKTTFENRMREIEMLHFNQAVGAYSRMAQQNTAQPLENSFKYVSKSPRESGKTFNPSVGRVESLSFDGSTTRYFDNRQNPTSGNPESHQIWYTCGQDIDPADGNEQELDRGNGGEDENPVEATINEIDIDETYNMRVKSEPIDSDVEQVNEPNQNESLSRYGDAEAISRYSCVSDQKGSAAGPSTMEPIMSGRSQSLNVKLGKVKSRAKEYSCDICGKVYMWKKRLQSHLISHRLGGLFSRKIDRLSQKVPVNYAALHVGKDPDRNGQPTADENKNSESPVQQNIVYKRPRGRPPSLYTPMKLINTVTGENLTMYGSYKGTNESDYWGSGSGFGESSTNLILNKSKNNPSPVEKPDYGKQLTLIESNLDQVGPGKRKRGRPRKYITLKIASPLNDNDISKGVILTEPNNCQVFPVKRKRGRPRKYYTVKIAAALNSMMNDAGQGVTLTDPRVGQVCPVKKRCGRPRKSSPLETALISDDRNALEFGSRLSARSNEMELDTAHHNHILPNVHPSTAYQTPDVCPNELSNESSLRTFEANENQPERPTYCVPTEMCPDISLSDNPVLKCQNKVLLESKHPGGKQCQNPTECLPLKVSSTSDAKPEHGKGIVNEGKLGKS